MYHKRTYTTAKCSKCQTFYGSIHSKPIPSNCTEQIGILNKENLINIIEEVTNNSIDEKDFELIFLRINLNINNIIYEYDINYEYEELIKSLNIYLQNYNINCKYEDNHGYCCTIEFNNGDYIILDQDIKSDPQYLYYSEICNNPLIPTTTT